jgi:hypothetical protein
VRLCVGLTIMSATPLGEGGLSQMMVCFETGRAPLGRKGRNRSSSVRRVPVYPMPRQLPRTTGRRYGTLGSIAKKGAERYGSTMEEERDRRRGGGGVSCSRAR